MKKSSHGIGADVLVAFECLEGLGLVRTTFSFRYCRAHRVQCTRYLVPRNDPSPNTHAIEVNNHILSSHLTSCSAVHKQTFTRLIYKRSNLTIDLFRYVQSHGGWGLSGKRQSSSRNRRRLRSVKISVFNLSQSSLTYSKAFVHLLLSKLQIWEQTWS